MKCTLTKTLSILMLASLLAACGSGSNKEQPAIVENPEGKALVALANTDLTFIQGQLITVELQNSGAGELTRCAADLPAGLVIDVSDDGSTCVIKGDAHLVQAATTISVTATNNAGDATSTITLQIDQATPYITTWKTDNAGASDDNQITIKTSADFNYDYRIDWGDDTFDENVTADITHTYETAGEYTVSITGVFPQPFFDNLLDISQTDSLKLLTVEQWGNRPWRSMARAFFNADNLVINDTENPDLSRVVSMREAFAEADNFNSDISAWDVSSVITMGFMFDGARAFDQNIGNWDITNVTNMEGMFNNNTLAIENYDALLNGWAAQDVQTGINFSADAQFSELAQTSHDVLTDAFGWEIEDNGLITLPNLETSTIKLYTNNNVVFPITNNGGNIDSCTSSNLPDGLTTQAGNGRCKIIGILSTAQASTAATITATNRLGSTDTDVSIEVQAETPYITTWKTDNEGASDDNQITIKTAPGFTYDYTIDWGDGTLADTNVTGDITHTYETSGTYTVSITGSYPAPFFDLTENLTQTDANKLLTVEQWGEHTWLSMNQAFFNADFLVINDAESPDLALVTDLSNMFRSASGFNSDISRWEVSNVTNMSGLFYGARDFNQNIGEWDTSSVTNMEKMFFRQRVFNQDISQWDVSNVRNMNGMFEAASGFDQDISQWNVGNVTNMSRMFREAKFNPNIIDWDVSKVTNMGQLFFHASLFNRDISGWDVSNVTQMSRMFEGARAFDQNLGSWNVSNVSSMSNMFSRLSTASYDGILAGWSQNTLKQGVEFSAGNATFSPESQAARDILTNTFEWTVTDGGVAEL